MAQSMQDGTGQPRPLGVEGAHLFRRVLVILLCPSVSPMTAEHASAGTHHEGVAEAEAIGRRTEMAHTGPLSSASGIRIA